MLFSFHGMLQSGTVLKHFYLTPFMNPKAQRRIAPWLAQAHILMKPEALCSGKPHAALKVYLVGTPVVRRAGDRRELGHI